MLHHRPCTPEPAGTRPSTPGSGRDPAPQEARGVAERGGSARLTVATRVGVWPAPWPMAARSLSPRSEERRGGKECRCGRAPEYWKKRVANVKYMSMA